MPRPDAASTHLARLGAGARPAGSARAANARAYCADVLRGAGFEIREQAFEYSAFPGALGAPLAGVLIPLLATIAWGTATHIDHISVWWSGVVIVVVIAALIARRLGGDGVLDLGLMRRAGVNLEAVRGQAEPVVWLVAHLDSKWQPVPMLGRVAGVVLLVAGIIAMLVETALGSHAPWPLVIVWLGGVPLIASFVGMRNHGTLDNASGVAAVLEAAELVPREDIAAIGVLITDAEELALAGARAWARAHARAHVGGGFGLNCDSVDDAGLLTVMRHRGPPSDLPERFVRAARDLGDPLRVIRLLPGVLTDSVALAAAGWRTVTLSRGTLRTLQRIHTSRDTLDTMRGTGIGDAARVLARVAEDLLSGTNLEESR